LFNILKVIIDKPSIEISNIFETPPVILATTFEAHQLRLLYLEDGRSAQEGSRAFQDQTLKLTTASPDANTRDLAAQPSERFNPLRD
jgi:plasmid maintenance system killer protein